MFVHSGASIHRHEYSPPVQYQNNSIPRRSPLARAAFSTPLITQNSLVTDKPTPIIRRKDRARSDSRLHEHMVRFQGLEPNIMDEEDGRSIISDSSNTTGRASRYKRRSAKPEWTYYFANPAPTRLQQQRILQIRPRLLLQLQHVAPGSRPMPAIDVLPSTVIIPRFVRRFPRMFRGVAELGANDLQIVKSESYDTQEDENNGGTGLEEDGYANRELLAVICEARKEECKEAPGKVEIVMADGTVWKATPQSSGCFDFITTDTEGNQTTARWSKPKRHSVDMSDTMDTNDIYFKFSIINSDSRRHAVLATLTSTQLKIPETYIPVSSSPSALPPATHNGITGRGSGGLSISVDEKLRLLIQVSGIWVALRKGLCHNFKYNDALANSITRPRAASAVVRSPSAATSVNGGLPSPCFRADTPESNHSAFAAVGDMIRRSCVLGSAPSSPFERSSTPQRSVSTGSAFVQKQTARRGQQPSTVASGSDTDSIPHITRARTDVNGSLSTPPPNGLSNSCSTTPDTPTRNPSKLNPRRIHSTLIPSTVGRGEASRETQSVDIRDRNGSPEHRKRQQTAVKPQKLSRWKSISNFFRRESRKSDSP